MGNEQSNKSEKGADKKGAPSPSVSKSSSTPPSSSTSSLSSSSSSASASSTSSTSSTSSSSSAAAPTTRETRNSIRIPTTGPPEVIADAPAPTGTVAKLDRPVSRLPVPEGAVVDDFFSQGQVKAKLTVEDFDLLKVVGKGSFGKVMQVRKKDNGRIYAMKVLKKAHLIARKQVAHTRTERRVLEEIDHPYIVHLRYAFQTDTKLYMVLDYFSGGELFFHLKNNGRFSEDRARFYAAEITLALECLHKHSIVYRDLKPENVLLDGEGHIRLTDFGLSKDGVTATNLTHTFCGTPEYLAPEVIQGAGYGLPVDWWSLGTLLYEMLTGMPPFYNQNLHVMYEKIIRAKLHFPAYLSSNCRNLLQQLLERNPQNRLGSIGDASSVKAHPFFSGLDWTLLSNRGLPAPFIPQNVDGETDVTNVDEEFKQEPAKDTPVNPSTLKSKVNFPGFTYSGDQEQNRLTGGTTTTVTETQKQTQNETASSNQNQ